MTVIAELRTTWAKIPLGSGRGGSGATEVDLLHVTLVDSDGVEGTGFSYALTGGAEGVHALLGGLLRQQTVGCELTEWPRRWRQVWDRMHRLGRGFALPALSAVDIAVWDLLSRKAELPLYRYLGAHTETVPVYGSGRSTHQMSTDELIAGTKAYLAEGYQAVKLRVGARRAEEDVERVSAVRQAVGSGVRLMVDCNERLDLPTALWLGRKFADLGVYWMEEPLSSDDIAGHAQLAQRTGVPIAVGEHLHGRFEFAAYLRQDAATVLQPDVPLTGGITEWLRISAIAEAFGAVLAPHFLPELHVHLAAAVPNCTYIEHFPLIDDVLSETLEITDGQASPPQRPGHGMRWNRDALENFRVA